MLQRVPKGHCAELTRRQIEVDELALVDRNVEFGADCGDGVGREFGSFGVYVLILQQPEEAAVAATDVKKRRSQAGVRQRL